MYLDFKTAGFFFVLLDKGKAVDCQVGFSPLEDGSFEVVVYLNHVFAAKFDHVGSLSVTVAKDYARLGWDRPMPDSEFVKLFPEG